MKGLDTNVLVRYLTQDDRRQSEKAPRAIQGAADRGESLFVSRIVLCELVWVLQAAYKYSHDEIVYLIDQILRAKQFEFDLN